METRLFDYHLPPELIAQTAAEPRDASRLMVVHRATGQIEHRIFREVREYLRPGDLLVLNQTRVIPARLSASKAQTGGRVEVLLLRRYDDLTWEALVRGRGLRAGARLEIHEAGRKMQDTALPPASYDAQPATRVTAEVIDETPSGSRLLRFDRPIKPLLAELGTLPLPPYIHKPLSEPERYQTVYGHVEGSVAASTAGLHFTPELLVALQRDGVEIAFVTLHIGLDTFQPVKEERVEDHTIHTEWFELTTSTAEQVNRARLEGRRIIAVGTTAVRALESAASPRTMSPSDSDRSSEPLLSRCVPEKARCGLHTVSAYEGTTDLFIYPGYRFLVVDAMITNFHLPRSTLLLLVSAFANRELIMQAYAEAIRQGYRFFSLGDAMLLL